MFHSKPFFFPDSIEYGFVAVACSCQYCARNYESISYRGKEVCREDSLIMESLSLVKRLVMELEKIELETVLEGSLKLEFILKKGMEALAPAGIFHICKR